MDIAYPFAIDGRGRSAQASSSEHIGQMIEQVLFTAPGERVNRPDFGTGLMQLVFGPNSPELASATEFMVQGALRRWLGELIKVESVQVSSEDSTLRVLVQYLVISSGERQLAQFTR
jgi:Bacteriophage baseplate protein W